MERKRPNILEKFRLEMKDNPVVEQLETEYVDKGKTTKDNIRELQEILVQTCIDYSELLSR